MDQIWTNILQFIGQLVSPDWGSIVGLVPLLLVLVVVLYLAWIASRFLNAGPTRRGKRRLEPRPPAGVHAAERSLSPFLAAFGCFALFYGLVLFNVTHNGWFLLIGIGVLALTLIYWLREGMRDYDHVEHPATAVLTLPSGTPPAGIHMPGPSFRPLLASIAMAVLLYGLVIGGWVLASGVLMLAIALLQWLTDARREYRGVVIADVTGHLPEDPRPGFPRGTLTVFGILFAGAIVLQAGLLPPKSATGGTGSSSGAGASPAASGAAGSPGAGGQPSAVAADVTVVAENISFAAGDHTAPAGKPFTILFQNKDAGIPHNISIRDGGATGPELWKGEIFPGADSRVYQVTTPLKAGSYTFICDVHPSMTGTLVVK